jgi:ketosteroid isomerase-like protein
MFMLNEGLGRSAGGLHPGPRVKRHSGRTTAIVIALLIVAAGATLMVTRRTSGDAAEVERVVVDFNRAISERRLDAAAALLAEGAVQLGIRPAHTFGGSADELPPLTSDLETSWRMVSGVLAAATARYDRSVRRMETRIEDRLATVWTTIRTESYPHDGTAVARTEFAEVYVLRREAAGWRIAATANSRPTR